MLDTPSAQATIRAAAAENRLLRLSDIDVPAQAMAYAVQQGTLRRVIAGVYIGAEHQRHALIEAAAWVLRQPRAVVGLLTAAVYYDLTTAFERGTWLLVPRSVPPPRSRVHEVHVIQTSEQFIDPADDDVNGIVKLRVHGVDVRITGPDRTVLDMLRYPRHVSSEHALEALRRRTRARDFRVPTFARLAHHLGVSRMVEPLIQGLTLR